MNENDTETIVKEFLEIWQKQCAYMSKDGDSLTAALDTFRQMQDSYVNSIMSGLGSPNDQPAATADILRNIGNGFTQLAKSYAELEKRVARLESGTAGGMAGFAKENPGKATKRTGKRTPKTNN